MKVIIQLQYSLTVDSRVFHDVKNFTQSSLHPTQPMDRVTQPMTNSAMSLCCWWL